MIVDIGGGTTDVAVISLGGIVESKSIKIAGDECDEAIVKYIRKKYNMMIGDMTAENLKKEIGCAYPYEEEKFAEIKGRNLLNGLPLTVRISSNDMLEALNEPVGEIVDAVHYVLERTPPELAADISSFGIYLTGGGALLYGLDKLIEEETGIKARIADNSVECVAIGTGKSLESLNLLEKNLQQNDSSRYR
jgi:rod shape-determining protein MreB